MTLPEPGSDKPFQMDVENRHDFTNLNELQIDWTLAEQSGRVTADVSPRTNDFRAMRTGIRRVSGADETGCGFCVVSNGRQAARSWIDANRIRLLLADFSHGTGERLLRTRGFPAAKALVLEQGQTVQGGVRAFLRIPSNISKQ